MKLHRYGWLLVLALLCGSRSGYAADGTFQGTVIKTPAKIQAVPGWIFVQGRNHLLRRVEVAHAVILLGRQGERSHQSCNLECLAVGQEIRVTAEQDSSGEWRAKRIEILRGGSTEKPLKARRIARIDDCQDLRLNIESPVNPSLYETLPGKPKSLDN